MGKPITQQRRGKGSSTFRAHGFRGKGKSQLKENVSSATVVDILMSKLHSAPLMNVKYNDNQSGMLVAPEGVRVGSTLQFGGSALEIGTILPLKDIPIGTMVCNIEGTPGDGGKFVRGSGGTAKVVANQGGKIIVLLPSKKRKEFHPNCRAMLGIIAGGGRKEKPYMKAGTKHHAMRAKGKFYPHVSGAAMNAVAHPFGGKRSSRKGRPTIAPRNAPPGRKVGMIRPRKTGRARGTRVRKS